MDSRPLNLTSIPALQDNYIWVLNNDQDECIIVDPGEARPVTDTIAANHWQPVAILLTHHHGDHVDGVRELTDKWPGLPVYGPAETLNKGTTQEVQDGTVITISGIEFTVIATPGHTLGHVSYYSKPYLFCGDTLFSGGCGRLFEGTAKQMDASFQRLNQLPADTLICCAHEYTLSNMAFARAVLPQNPHILSYYHKIKQLRDENQITLPSSLEKEREINVFLKTHDIDLQRNILPDLTLPESWQVFEALRRKKDSF